MDSKNISFRREIGDHFPVDCNIVPVIDKNNKVGTLLSFRDISDVEKAQSLLVEAKQNADILSRAKDEFFIVMNHELRSPLNGILGTIKLLADTTLDQNQRSYIESLQLASNNLNAITEGVMIYTSIESGKFDSEPVEFELRAFLASITELYSRAVDNNSIQLTLEYQSDAINIIRADVDHLRRILGQFVENAIKFTRKGSIKIIVSQGSSSTDQLKIRISVLDTGMGIDAKYQKNLFEVFTKAEASVNRDHNGSGLGLAICKKLIHRMGGCIGVESQIGQGSNFWIEFPIWPEADSRADKLAS